MKYKQFGLLGIVCVATMLVAALALSMQESGFMPKAYIVFAAGVPDSYGNQIMNVYVEQNDGGWSTAATITSSNYTEGVNVEIDANIPTRLYAMLRLNYTFASSTAEAMAFTRAYVNVSGEIVNEQLGNSTAADMATYWRVYTDTCTEWTPATDTTYQVTVEYEVYY